MPLANRFRHQEYHCTAPISEPHLLSTAAGPPIDSDAFLDRMRAAGDRFRAAGVAAIYLVHGTFVGGDAAGLIASLGRLFPAAEPRLRDLAKQIIDALVGDAGNYTQEFASLFEQAIQREGQRLIPVKLFRWSGQNNHIGRADAAIRLVETLHQSALAARDAAEAHTGIAPKAAGAANALPTGDPPAAQWPGQAPRRILLWGHSHAGNVFALLTNLLGADAATLAAFFRASRVYYRWPILGIEDQPAWPRVRDMLLEVDRPLDDLALDLVTFGAPIRYGWEAAGYSNLLHFINHRPAPGLAPFRAPFPPRVSRVQTAEDGDYVQATGIAGTNFAPTLFDWRSLLADIRLGKLLQPHLRKRDLLARLKRGARVPDEGSTLLVDYGPGIGGIAKHAAGHAVYTRAKWLLFHAEEVVARFYGARRCRNIHS